MTKALFNFSKLVKILTLFLLSYLLTINHIAQAATPDTTTLTGYAQACDSATGTKVPEFDCDLGTEVPGDREVDGKCDYPNVLRGECDPGSRFQVLYKKSDAIVVAHCRKQGNADKFYGDIAVIQHNNTTGATCFYQALGTLSAKVPAPLAGSGAWKEGGNWMTPKATHDIGCTSCHDTGPFVRSPYLAQMNSKLVSGKRVNDNNPDKKYTYTEAMTDARTYDANGKIVKRYVSDAAGKPTSTVIKNYLPNSYDVNTGYGNYSSTPLNYPGDAWKNDNSWDVTVSNVSTDKGTNCTSCHAMGLSNQTKTQGTSLNFGVIATDKEQASKNPHSKNSPIWMRKDQVTYNKDTADTALKFQICASEFANNGYKETDRSKKLKCKFTPHKTKAS